MEAEVLDYCTLTDKIIRTGSTMPDEEVDLSFESSGKIVDIYFQEGSHVKAGELLAKINDAPLQAQLKKLQAQDATGHRPGVPASGRYSKRMP